MTERFNQAAEGGTKGICAKNIAHSKSFQTITSRIALLNNMNIMDFGAGTDCSVLKSLRWYQTGCRC